MTNTELSQTKKFSIILTGGGTAGHVWPHFALFEGKNPLAEYFQQDRCEVHYVGSYQGMEKDLVTKTQPRWHYHSISTGKLRRYFSLQNFLDPFKIILGFLQAFLLVGKVKPAVVFSKGGFVSAPMVWAAWLREIPVVIHESDATVALATKLTLPFCRKALFAFSETIEKIPAKFRHKAVASGLPVRVSLFESKKEEALSFFQFQSNKKVLLIFGGSLGARSLNEKAFDMLPNLLEKYQIIHIVGKGNQLNVSLGDKQNLLENYRQYEFLNEQMKFAYAAADLAICRAGASSIFELAAARIPMILVPLGLHASRGDQIINAQIFSKKGWAQCIDEQLYSKENTLQMIDSTIASLDEKKHALENAPSSEAANQISQLLWDTMK